VRFALAWLIPAWLVFELSPTKLPHYPLPLLRALAWLAAAALSRPVGPRARWERGGAGLAGGRAAWRRACGYLQSEYGDPSDTVATVLTGALFAGAGLLGSGAAAAELAVEGAGRSGGAWGAGARGADGLAHPAA
jgi:4-amino-4-deoxy-L-arabinose transferase-like glycosyltransferase